MAGIGGESGLISSPLIGLLGEGLLDDLEFDESLTFLFLALRSRCFASAASLR